MDITTLPKTQQDVIADVKKYPHIALPNEGKHAPAIRVLLTKGIIKVSVDSGYPDIEHKTRYIMADYTPRTGQEILQILQKEKYPVAKYHFDAQEKTTITDLISQGLIKEVTGVTGSLRADGYTLTSEGRKALTTPSEVPALRPSWEDVKALETVYQDLCRKAPETLKEAIGPDGGYEERKAAHIAYLDAFGLHFGIVGMSKLHYWE